jgi:hypothetical protein
MILFAMLAGVILILVLAGMGLIMLACKMHEIAHKMIAKEKTKKKEKITNEILVYEDETSDLINLDAKDTKYPNYQDIIVTLKSPVLLSRLPLSPLSICLEATMTNGRVQKFYVDSNVSKPQRVTICHPEEIRKLDMVIESWIYDEDGTEYENILRLRRVHTAYISSIHTLQGITANISVLGDTIDVEFEDHVILTPKLV